MHLFNLVKWSLPNLHYKKKKKNNKKKQIEVYQQIKFNFLKVCYSSISRVIVLGLVLDILCSISNILNSYKFNKYHI